MSSNPVSVKELSAKAEAKMAEMLKLYPDPRSSVMPALYIAQEEFGLITNEAIEWVSARVNIPPVHVREVATFYTMYYHKQLGRYHFQVCRTLPCALRGAKKISAHLQKKLGLMPREVSSDGMFSYEEVECLGSCGTAPMCQINDTFFENLDEQKLDQILAALKETKPDLKFSTINDSLGAGLVQFPKGDFAKSMLK